MSFQPDPAAVYALERQAADALRRGQDREALALWTRLLALQPEHSTALTQVGQAAFKQGDFNTAHQVFTRAAAVDGSMARPWVNVALACQQLKDEAGEEAAIFKALSADPYDLLALVLRGALCERQGKTAQAASAYGAVAAVAPPMDRLAPDLRGAVSYAMNFQEAHQQKLAAFIDQYLDPHLAGYSGAHLDRFKLSVDILLGRKRRHDPQPMRYYMPQLPVTEFFERQHFPWLEELESHTAAIREECRAVLAGDDAQLQPYITYGADQPIAQWAELNHSPRWSVYHLVKDGLKVEEHAVRCPQTMAAWARTPSPDQPGRTPVAMYSLLKPHTRIPAHVGASNCRLVVHLPLVVPESCRFRVGNSTRVWEEGRAWVFDDTIEHEAWNDSDQLRAVMIFDTWHPLLNEDERRMITALNAALNAFGGATATATATATASNDYDV